MTFADLFFFSLTALGFAVVARLVVLGIKLELAESRRRNGGILPIWEERLIAKADRFARRDLRARVRAVDVLSPMAVRRLTPRECERLMGWPDDHTAGFPDSVRYKMCGNGVVRQCAEWIARRIVKSLKA